MSDLIGICEHRISSQATCPECAIKLEQRIAELGNTSKNLRASLDELGNDRVTLIDRIAELEAENKALREQLKGEQHLTRFYKEWALEAGVPLPPPPQEPSK